MIEVSVCVATHHRPGPLAECLQALGEQALGPDLVGRVEIVVADDASPASDDIAGVVDRARATGPVPITLVALPVNQGPGAARNAAVAAARGAWILFTDDDCRPRRGWVGALVAAAQRTGADIVQGRTVPDPRRAHLVGGTRVRTLDVDGEHGFYQTCNIAYRRATFDRAGGFDRRFARSGEDTDLAWRARAAGATTTFAADAVVEHAVVAQTRLGDLRSRARWADIPAVVARHPHLRRHTWRGPVYRRSHVAPLAAAATLPALGVRALRPVWLLAAAVAVGAEAARAGSPTAAIDAFARRAADAYETAVVVRGALRARTVLL